MKMRLDPAAGEVARANALKVSTRLRTPVQTDLRGALLRGEDLSYRELAGVDLTGAPPHRIQAAGLARSFQITNLFRELSIYENLRLSLQARRVAPIPTPGNPFL